MRLVAGGAPGECGVLVQRLQQQVEDAQPEGCGGWLSGRGPVAAADRPTQVPAPEWCQRGGDPELRWLRLRTSSRVEAKMMASRPRPRSACQAVEDGVDGGGEVTDVDPSPVEAEAEGSGSAVANGESGSGLCRVGEAVQFTQPAPRRYSGPL
jgi:hypothetical protein